MPGGKIDILIHPDMTGFEGKLKSGLNGATGIASTAGKAIGLALAGGTALAAVGLREVIKIGNEYSANLNELQAVSGATAVEMAQVGKVAQALGSDMSLPATSAADAAAAMVELAKGGLSVADSMKAAKGTLQLAAAAQVDAAQAAEIQSNALNQFGLAADQAGHVADVLANTANAASGSILDMANALKYVGPVARSLAVDIDSTAAAIGLLANNGIQSEQAGTSLRAILASLAAPSKAAAGAMEDLNLKVFDQAGKFLGLRAVTDQLAAAKKRLTDQEFANLAATAFGNESLSSVNALANSGVAAFDAMATSVGRAGGAASVAAAKSKGLGGALEGLRSQAETIGIGVYEAIAPPLESAVRESAESLAKGTDDIVKFAQNAVAAGELVGPSLAKAIEDRAGAAENALRQVLEPLAESAGELLSTGFSAGLALFRDSTDVLDELTAAAAPVARGIRDIVQAAGEGGGALNLFASGLDVAGDVVSGLASLLVPVGQVIGGIASAFADLPSPVLAAVAALAAYKLLLPQLDKLAPVAAMRQFSSEMQVQRALAAQSGESLSRYGAAMAAFESSTVRGVAAARGFRDQTVAIRDGAAAVGQPISTMSASIGALGERVPVIAQMRSAFSEAAAGAERFGVGAGLAAAGATGLKAGFSGLSGLLGGPLGVAITGVTIGLSFLASHHAEAEAAAQRSASAEQAYADALRESQGQITGSIRSQAAKRAQDSEALDLARKLGVSLSEVTDAILGQGNAYNNLRSRVQGIVDAETAWTNVGGNAQKAMTDKGKAASDLLVKLAALSGEFSNGAQKQKDLDEAIKSGRASMLDSTQSGRTLGDAIKRLGDNSADADSKARALKDALDVLSGGQISADKAFANLNEQIGKIGPAFKAAGAEASAAGKSIIDSSGAINTTTDAGRRLQDTAEHLGQSMASAAQAAFNLAREQGKSLPEAMAAAVAKAKETRGAFLDAAGAAQIGATEAEKLANRWGLVPDNVATLVSTPGMTDTQRELVLLKAKFDAVPGQKSITVTSLTDEARKQLESLGFKVTHMENGTVEVTANTEPAKALLDSYVANASRKSITIPVYTTWQGPSGPIPYGSAGRYEHGGIATAVGYAAGGTHRLNPMRGGYADVVGPNTWRVIGDRIRDDEAYIPINQSARSMGILSETANRMGFALLRMYADGAVARSSVSSPPQQMTVSGGGDFTGQLVLDSGQFLGAVQGVVQRHSDSVGSSINRRRRFG